MNLYSGDIALQNGDKYFNSDLKTARLWYTIALEDKEYRIRALNRLINLERRAGRFQKARDYINSLDNSYDFHSYLNIGKLEMEEHNYVTAIEYFSNSLTFTELQNHSLMNIADCYVQLGEFETARRMLETTKNYVLNGSIFGIINIDIIEGDYNHALKISEEIKFLNAGDFSAYNNYYITIMYSLGRINELDINKFKGSYTLKRLKSEEMDLLFEHLKKHENQNIKYDTHFKSGLINNEFILGLEDKIKSLVPSYSMGGLKYGLRLPFEIGYTFDNDPLKSLAIVTTIDGKKILTIYPIELSNKFDMEGLTQSEDLKKKRLMGVKR